jgi:hypothetical protein
MLYNTFLSHNVNVAISINIFFFYLFNNDMSNNWSELPHQNYEIKM